MAAWNGNLATHQKFKCGIFRKQRSSFFKRCFNENANLTFRCRKKLNLAIVKNSPMFGVSDFRSISHLQHKVLSGIWSFGLNNAPEHLSSCFIDYVIPLPQSLGALTVSEDYVRCVKRINELRKRRGWCSQPSWHQPQRCWFSYVFWAKISLASFAPRLSNFISGYGVARKRWQNISSVGTGRWRPTRTVSFWKDFVSFQTWVQHRPMEKISRPKCYWWRAGAPSANQPAQLSPLCAGEERQWPVATPYKPPPSTMTGQARVPRVEKQCSS